MGNHGRDSSQNDHHRDLLLARSFVFPVEFVQVRVSNILLISGYLTSIEANDQYGTESVTHTAVDRVQVY